MLKAYEDSDVSTERQYSNCERPCLIMAADITKRHHFSPAMQVWTSSFLMPHIMSFNRGKKYREWRSGDQAAALGYLTLIKEKTAEYEQKKRSNAQESKNSSSIKGGRSEASPSVSPPTGIEYEKLIFSKGAIDKAATNGWMDVVEWLHQNRDEGCTLQALTGAATNGHLEIVRYLLEGSKRKRVLATSNPDRSAAYAMQSGKPLITFTEQEHKFYTEAMDGAAGKGHLDVLKLLHEHSAGSCSVKAMDDAASNGHLDVVEWLSKHRTEGCTYRAITNAASNGHLAVAQYLYAEQTRPQEHGGGAKVANYLHKDVINNAAENGFLDVIQWVHSVETGLVCYTHGVNAAANGGQFPVVEFLLPFVPDSEDLEYFTIAAAKTGNLAILKLLYARGQKIPRNCAVVAAYHGYRHIIEWLCSINQWHLFTEPHFHYLQGPIERKETEFVKYLQEILSMAPNRADADAFKQNSNIDDEFYRIFLDNLRSESRKRHRAQREEPEGDESNESSLPDGTVALLRFIGRPIPTDKVDTKKLAETSPVTLAAILEATASGEFCLVKSLCEKMDLNNLALTADQSRESCFFGFEDLRRAIIYGHVEMVDYMLAWRKWWHSRCAQRASASNPQQQQAISEYPGPYDILRELMSTSCDSYVISNAIRKGNLHVLSWLREQAIHGKQCGLWFTGRFVLINGKLVADPNPAPIESEEEEMEIYLKQLFAYSSRPDHFSKPGPGNDIKYWSKYGGLNDGLYDPWCRYEAVQWILKYTPQLIEPRGWLMELAGRGKVESLRMVFDFYYGAAYDKVRGKYDKEEQERRARGVYFSAQKRQDIFMNIENVYHSDDEKSINLDLLISSLAKRAAEKGQSHVIRWLYLSLRIPQRCPSQPFFPGKRKQKIVTNNLKMLTYLVRNGDLAMIEWLDTFFPNDLEVLFIVNLCAMFGQERMLHWATRRYSPLMTQSAHDYSCFRGFESIEPWEIAERLRLIKKEKRRGMKRFIQGWQNRERLSKSLSEEHIAAAVSSFLDSLSGEESNFEDEDDEVSNATVSNRTREPTEQSAHSVSASHSRGVSTTAIGKDDSKSENGESGGRCGESEGQRAKADIPLIKQRRPAKPLPRIKSRAIVEELFHSSLMHHHYIDFPSLIFQNFGDKLHSKFIYDHLAQEQLEFGSRPDRYTWLYPSPQAYIKKLADELREEEKKELNKKRQGAVLPAANNRKKSKRKATKEPDIRSWFSKQGQHG